MLYQGHVFSADAAGGPLLFPTPRLGRHSATYGPSTFPIRVMSLWAVGSYHWRVDGQAWPTVDDLEDKAFLGATPDDVFATLRQALDTALALHAEGLEFVVAPIPTRAGHTLFRLSLRYSLARYPAPDGPEPRLGRAAARANRVRARRPTKKCCATGSARSISG